MNDRLGGRALAAIAITAALLPAAPTLAHGFGFRSELPECSDDRVHRRIVERSGWADRRTWKKGVAITAIEGVRQSRLVARGPRRIAERYCRATARLTDGRRVRLYFLIEDQMGYAGTGWYVSFCLPGRDPYRVYDGRCRVVRPF